MINYDWDNISDVVLDESTIKILVDRLTLHKEHNPQQLMKWSYIQESEYWGDERVLTFCQQCLILQSNNIKLLLIYPKDSTNEGK